MRQLLDALGSPQKGLRTVHVAGTKGKGSTVAFLENILLQSGYKVGAFTSPKVRSVGELFRVDGREASEVALDRLLTWVRARVEAESLNPTYFEVMTALAYVLIGDVMWATDDCDGEPILSQSHSPCLQFNSPLGVCIYLV